MPAASRDVLAAVWHGGQRLVVQPWPLPEMGEGDVLVRVEGCGVCGSDAHIVAGQLPEFVPPRVLGHEPLGVVEAAGRSVSAFRPGDQVTWEPSLPCRACWPCRQGEDGLCEQRVQIPGAFAERTVVPERALCQVPDGLPEGIGVLAEPLSCALYAHDRGRVRVGDVVAVIGAGTIGLLLTMLARRAGARRVVVCDPVAGKRDLARRVGADEAVDSSAGEQIRRLTAGRGADVAFEAVGTAATVLDTLRAVRPGGTAVLVGISPPGTTGPVPLFDLVRRDITVEAVWLRRFTFQRAVSLLAELPLQQLISHHLPLADLPRAFELLRSGSAVKVVIRP